MKIRFNSAPSPSNRSLLRSIRDQPPYQGRSLDDKEQRNVKKTDSKQNLNRRVLARALAQELPAVSGGGGPLIKTHVNGHLDVTDSGSQDTLA
jgi:hypothetical protein